MKYLEKQITNQKSSIYIYRWIILFGFLYFVGGNLNYFVMLNNSDCKMPVYHITNFTTDYQHFIYQDKATIKYYYLSDIFETENYIYSIGDAIIYIGYFGLLTLLIYNIVYPMGRLIKIYINTSR